MYVADCKKYSLFLNFTLIFTIAKNYSLVLNFTPYFHEQGVNYSFGKTLVRALYICGSNKWNSDSDSDTRWHFGAVI